MSYFNLLIYLLFSLLDQLSHLLACFCRACLFICLYLRHMFVYLYILLLAFIVLVLASYFLAHLLSLLFAYLLAPSLLIL